MAGKRLLKGGAIGLLLIGGCVLIAGFWIPLKGWVAQYLLRSAYERSLVTGQRVLPWSWADTWPVGRLRCERLGVDLIVLEGENGSALAFGPGRLRSGGTVGSGEHIVLYGHRDTCFGFLKYLREGDILVLEGVTGTTRYAVAGGFVEDAAKLYFSLRPPGAGPVLSLVTCYPFDAIHPQSRQRFVVRAIAKEVGSPPPSTRMDDLDPAFGH